MMGPPMRNDNDAIVAALAAMRSGLPPPRKVILSLRDYASLLKDRPSCMPPRFYSDEGRRRIVFQVWDWRDERGYRAAR